MSQVTDKIRAAIDAFERGERIELRRKDSDKPWEAITCPAWNFCEFEYRPVRKPRRFYISKYISGEIVAFHSFDEAGTADLASTLLEVIPVVEDLNHDGND